MGLVFCAPTPSHSAPAQVVVDQIPPGVLVSNCATATFDFLSITEGELQEIVIPLSLQVATPCPGRRRRVQLFSAPRRLPSHAPAAPPACRCRFPSTHTRLLSRSTPAPLLPALQCTAWPPGLTSSSTAPRTSAGCPPRPACPSRTGEAAAWGEHCALARCSCCWLCRHADLSLLSHSSRPCPPVCRFQLRCLLEQPVVVAQPGATVSGELRLVAHSRQSYDVHVTLRAPPLTPGGPPQARGWERRAFWCVEACRRGWTACLRLRGS